MRIFAAEEVLFEFVCVEFADRIRRGSSVAVVTVTTGFRLKPERDRLRALHHTGAILFERKGIIERSPIWRLCFQRNERRREEIASEPAAEAYHGSDCLRST